MSNTGLSECIERISKGSWQFIQLRGASLSQGDINAGDVDLLGSRESVDELLDAAYRWTREGICHMHVSRRNLKKVMLILFSIDGEEELVLDLWLTISQFVSSELSITYEVLRPIMVAPEQHSAIKRLPVELEACVYLHHLAKKKKDISKAYIQERLIKYNDLLVGTSVEKLVENVIENGAVSSLVLEEAFSVVSKAASLERPCFWRTIFATHLKATRKGHLLCVMGCDGVGKTSLTVEAAKYLRPEGKLFKGKHFYRKSILYKLTVIFIRPFLLQSREKYDESIAVFVYLRACFGLLLKRISNRPSLMLYDRNLVDFILLKRKTDRPRWSVFYFLTSVFGNRVPTVHCIADFKVISLRKLEITKAGHAIYDEMLFKHFAYRIPTEYTVFNNERDLSVSCEAFLNVIRSEEYPINECLKVSKDCP